MTPHIEAFLSRARLTATPYTQQDIDAAEARILARLENPSTAAPVLEHAAGQLIPETPEHEAAQSLQTLCETVVVRTGLQTLDDFITPHLPEPPGARVLGCILQLAESEENARFWWQYAAGAGDPASSYCLYLHHLALGEQGEARWWHDQTELVQDALPATDTTGNATTTPAQDVPSAVTAALNQVTTTDASLLPTALRILGALKTEPTPMPAAVGAVIDYVPAAVGYVDGLDLPLTDPDFTDHIRTLTADTKPARTSRPAPTHLERRPKHAGPGISAARRHTLRETWPSG
ncbi:hypothetical protein [Streptomyces sp. NBC_01602]|uniref:hypothetical protein n=1 Tax=Streptomyces sp. NBC_01602 TaxID=2975893 RepID=UPI003864D059|nr:hypothetical protein OG955_00445 [Streptomyces sp. NBC_01602]